MGRALLTLGLVLAVLGLVLMALEHASGPGSWVSSLVSSWLSRLPFGRLPGDLRYRSRNVTVFAPLGTSLVLSVLLTLLLALIARLRR